MSLQYCFVCDLMLDSDEVEFTKTDDLDICEYCYEEHQEALNE